MNEQIANSLVDAELKRLRKLPYFELRNLVARPQSLKVVGEDEKTYQLEIQAVWDRKKDEDLRVIVAVDDGGLRSFKPLIQDFIVRPDGTFVG
jgi:hypothetical protein